MYAAAPVYSKDIKPVRQSGDWQECELTNTGLKLKANPRAGSLAAHIPGKANQSIKDNEWRTMKKKTCLNPSTISKGASCAGKTATGQRGGGKGVGTSPQQRGKKATARQLGPAPLSLPTFAANTLPPPQPALLPSHHTSMLNTLPTPHPPTLPPTPQCRPTPSTGRPTSPLPLPLPQTHPPLS